MGPLGIPGAQFEELAPQVVPFLMVWAFFGGQKTWHLENTNNT